MNKVVLLAALVFGLVGCEGCKTSVAPEGVYKGDNYLYQSELAINTAYTVLHTYVSWENDNREVLSNHPEIKNSADTIRTHAKEWFKTARAAHDVYKVNPTDANKKAFELTMSAIRSALAEALNYMTEAATH